MSKGKFLLKYGHADHITDVMNDKHGDYGSGAIVNSSEKNPSWNHKHTQKVIDQDWGYHVQSYAIKHPTTTPEQLNHAIDTGNHNLALVAALHPNATEDQHMRVLDSDKWTVARLMIDDAKLSRKVYEKAAEHPHHLVRQEVASSIQTPDHVLDKLEKDPDSDVANRAKKTKAFNKDMDDFGI